MTEQQDQRPEQPGSSDPGHTNAVPAPPPDKKPWLPASLLIFGGLALVYALNAPDRGTTEASPASNSYAATSEPAPIASEQAPRAEPFVRPEIPRSPDPVVIDAARRYLFDDRQQLKNFDNEWDRAELFLHLAKLAEAGHQPGVLTLARDMCFPGRPIENDQRLALCKVAAVINDTLRDHKHAVAATDTIYRSIAMAAFLQQKSTLANGEAFLTGVERSIDRARALGGDEREMAMLSGNVQALKADMNRGSEQTAAAILGIIGILASSESTPEQEAADAEYWKQRAEQEEQDHRNECLALAMGGDKDFWTSGC